MPSSQHRKLLSRILSGDEAPQDSDGYAEWLARPPQLSLLRDNAIDQEIIIYASSKYTFIHSVLVSSDALDQLSNEAVLDWSGNPFDLRAGYCWGGGRNDVWIDESSSIWPSIPSEHVKQLVFVRIFHELREDDAVSYEIRQEYLHASQIFWRPEHDAYCRFDDYGDFDPIVSVTPRGGDHETTLITFQRSPLEEFLAATDSVLVQTFDFTLFRSGEFHGWSDDPDQAKSEGNDIIYRYKIDGQRGSYYRGVQILKPSRTKAEIFESMRMGPDTPNENAGVEFIAFDWRNERLAYISTHADATTSYFQASGNNLPFEMSPAFFRPDVLLRYKADQDKYTVGEAGGTINCRGAWALRTYGVNEEGQVFTYIRYLRNLPHDEQMYWRSFNQRPKAGIPEHVIQRDFKGEWTSIDSPLGNVRRIIGRWSESRVAWWTLGDGVLLERLNTPRTTSRDEWGRSFSDLAKLVVQGFRVKVIRAKLSESGVEFDSKERSIKLMERLLSSQGALDDGERLVNLRLVQLVRSKVDAHYGGSEAQEIAQDSMSEHGSFTAHFESVCEGLADELEMIEQSLS